jgi:hypothetical protein
VVRVGVRVVAVGKGRTACELVPLVGLVRLIGEGVALQRGRRTEASRHVRRKTASLLMVGRRAEVGVVVRMLLVGEEARRRRSLLIGVEGLASRLHTRVRREAIRRRRAKVWMTRRRKGHAI